MNFLPRSQHGKNASTHKHTQGDTHTLASSAVVDSTFERKTSRMACTPSENLVMVPASRRRLPMALQCVIRQIHGKTEQSVHNIRILG